MAFARGSRASGRVLVADDETEVRRAFSRVLRHVGYTVEEAPDGRTAQELITRGGFDAIISDISMPDMTGLDVLRHARERDEDVPVILVTGGPAVETAVQAIEYGVYRYLIKPVEPKEMLAVIDKAVLLYRMAQIRRDVSTLLGGEDRAKLETDFDRALSTLWMAYQPIVRADGSIFGYEALLRSNEPALPHPGAVLDAAERLGRLMEVGRTVRGSATGSFKAAPSDAALFVNLHPRDLLDPMLMAPDSPLVQMADRVVLEITERASLSEIRDLRSRIADLRSLGFRIAVDDLGAGYAGLTSFSLLEPEVVKIDMALVRDVDKQPMKRKLIGSIAGFCRDMGMMVVGEGVETPEERDTLIEIGCPLLQGYHFGKPARLPQAPTS